MNRNQLCLFVISAAVAVAAGCAPSPTVDEGPTNEEIMQSTGLTVAEATRVAAANLSVAVGVPLDPARERVVKVGCRTDPESLMSIGPPYRVRLSHEVAAPSPDVLAEAMARVEKLTDRGFELQPRTPNDQTPEDRTYQDDKGYTVITSTSVMVLGGPGLTIYSNSPCAAE
ncbi:hypothetical protein [Antrihabitans spumae]|jgi:hypothetical protein|uniref:PASTA domain-containing protein n=1 Tax=Antrihabitans spumae TaxID=3373370 RepID=A0ABW7JTI7_9NOCA